MAGENSRCMLVERYGIDCIGALAAGTCLTNAVTEFVLEAGAKVRTAPGAARRHADLPHRLHRRAPGARQQLPLHRALPGRSPRPPRDPRRPAASRARSATCTGSTCHRRRGTCDNHTVVDHEVPHCRSRQLYKGILGGKARGVFTGRVIVRPDAQKTDAKQTNQNLLLSRRRRWPTPSRSSRSTPTTSSAPTAPRSARSTRTRSSTCARAASAAGRARDLLVHAFASEVIASCRRCRIAQAARGADRLRAWTATPKTRGRDEHRPGQARLDARRGRPCGLPHPRAGGPRQAAAYLDNAATTQKPRRGPRRRAHASTRSTTPTSTAACTA